MPPMLAMCTGVTCSTSSPAALPTGAAAVWAAVAVLRFGTDRAGHACIIAHAYGIALPQRMKPPRLGGSCR